MRLLTATELELVAGGGDSAQISPDQWGYTGSGSVDAWSDGFAAIYSQIDTNHWMEHNAEIRQIAAACAAAAASSGSSDVHPIPIVSVGVPVTDPHYLDAVHAANVLQDRLLALCSNMALVNDSAVYALPGGAVISGADLKSYFYGTNYTVNNVDYGAQRAGENDLTGNVNINYGDLAGWEAWGEEGLNTIIFHEIGHEVPGGVANLTADFNSYFAQHPNDPQGLFYPGTPQFIHNEAYANSSSVMLNTALGLVSMDGLNGHITPTNGLLPQ